LFDTFREWEGDLAFAAQYCTPETVNFALTIGRGILCVAMPPETAQVIGVKRLESNHLDPLRTPFGMPISLANGSSGVSVKDRCETIRATCRADAKPSDFCTPGHVATLIAHADGLAGRQGHTETILASLSMAGVVGCGVLCEILDSDGSIASQDALKTLSNRYELPMLDISDVISAFSAGK
jgi:3,4-dihydroxy 2-butanone 4-phosphate synthase/GTP cyclohydrolase II